MLGDSRDRPVADAKIRPAQARTGQLGVDDELHRGRGELAVWGRPAWCGVASLRESGAATLLRQRRHRTRHGPRGLADLIGCGSFVLVRGARGSDLENLLRLP